MASRGIAGRASSTAASGRLGVISVGQRQQLAHGADDGVVDQEAVAALRHHDRVEDDPAGPAPVARASATSWTSRLASMPTFTASTPMSSSTASIWAR
jgi:hypothetical protein